LGRSEEAIEKAAKKKKNWMTSKKRLTTKMKKGER